MPIKEKSVFKKHEYEYESPDGDKFAITYVEHQDREYVEIARQNADGSVTEKVVWDVAMFNEIADILSKIKYSKSGSQPPTRGLVIPNITDHRFGRAQMIERSVNDSMRRFDDSVQPVESFDATDPARVVWQKNATGIDPEVMGEIGETPEEISLEGKDPSSLIAWQRDALRRQTSPVMKDPAKAIKRIGAADLM